MNKRFALIALLLAAVMLLSGCNLIGHDDELDGAQVVATVETNQGSTEITKAEWEAYRDYLASYYQQYYQQYFGVTMQLTDDDVKAVSYTHLLTELKGGIDGVPTGFVDLDNLLTGLHGGELVIVGARPSMGKTSFAMNIIGYAATMAGKTTAMFSLEMPKDQPVSYTHLSDCLRKTQCASGFFHVVPERKSGFRHAAHSSRLLRKRRADA